jgi:hypothetical protein
MNHRNRIDDFYAWRSDDGDVLFTRSTDPNNIVDDFAYDGLINGKVDLNVDTPRVLISDYIQEVKDDKKVDYNKYKYESYANIVVEITDECGEGKVTFTDMTAEDWNYVASNYYSIAILVKDKWAPTKGTHLILETNGGTASWEDCDGNQITKVHSILGYLPQVNDDYLREIYLYFEDGEIHCLNATYDGHVG